MCKQIRRDTLVLNKDGLIARLARELIVANKELAFQAVQKGKRADELMLANDELAFQTVEKGKRADELIVANEELAFQTVEKGKRANELVIANEELALQKELAALQAQYITERKLAEETLLDAYKLNQAILQSVQEGVIVYGLDLRYQVWNPFMEQLTGKPAHEVLGRHPLEVFPFLSEMGIRERLGKALAGEEVAPIDFPFEDQGTGKSGWSINALDTLRDSEGKIIGAIGTVTDITERKLAEAALRESEAQNRAILRTTLDAIVTSDQDGKIVGWNRGAQILFGYTEAEAMGQLLTILMPERFREGHSNGMHRVGSGGLQHVIGKTVELAGLRKDQSEFPLELSLSMWETSLGWKAAGIIRDITDRKEAEDRLEQLASTDLLTSSWNRRHFLTAVGAEIHRSTRYGHPISLLLLDIDHFKRVNDTFGHPIGDQVLCEVANRIRATIRVSDSLTRWGGEEFLVLMPNTDLSDAMTLAERIRERIATHAFNRVGTVTASLGVAEYLSSHLSGDSQN